MNLSMESRASAFSLISTIELVPDLLPQVFLRGWGGGVGGGEGALIVNLKTSHTLARL